MNFENVILYNLSNNSEFTQKILPHLKKDFFKSFFTKEIYQTINKYVDKYKALPTKSIIAHELSKNTAYDEKQYEALLENLDDVFKEDEKHNIDWLLDETEKYCQNVAFQTALLKCFDIYKSEKVNKMLALDIMKDALAVSFESSHGIDFFDEAAIEKRFEEYNSPDILFKTGVETFDLACGGLKAKGITILMGGSGSGKTAGMISLICGCLKAGYNVAYFTMEMSETEISKRVEANLMDVEINSIRLLDLDVFKTNLYKFKEANYGKLKIKEFPTAAATCSDFDHCLNQWKIRDGFKPQIIVADYLNIMSSNRIGKEANSYTLVKGIVEEFRGLNVKWESAGLSGTQLNRDGMDSSKLNFKNISDSVATIFTTDVLVGIISTEQTREENYQIFQVMKNRNTGIIDFFFPLKTNFSCSKIYEDFNESYNDQILLSNNPETLLRIDKLKNGNDVIRRKKKEESNFMPLENVDLVFDEPEVFEILFGDPSKDLPF